MTGKSYRNKLLRRRLKKADTPVETVKAEAKVDEVPEVVEAAPVVEKPKRSRSKKSSSSPKSEEESGE